MIASVRNFCAPTEVMGVKAGESEIETQKHQFLKTQRPKLQAQEVDNHNKASPFIQ